MKKTIGCDPLVLATLQRAEKDEIDYLVDVVTYQGRGRLALSSSKKDLLLEEKNNEENYSEDALRYLIQEFQNYGGHAVLNMFRKDAAVPYEEILTDVHKKLNGTDSNKKSTTDKEMEIVHGLFGDQWFDLPEFERFERSNGIWILVGLFKLEDNLKFDEKGAVAGLSTLASAAAFAVLRLHPITAAVSTLALLNQMGGEAYRVTVPFVAQIAWIRMRLQVKQ